MGALERIEARFRETPFFDRSLTRRSTGPKEARSSPKTATLGF